MTDVGEYTDADFAEIWEQIRVAEQQTNALDRKLDTLHASLDQVLVELDKPLTEVASAEPEEISRRSTTTSSK